MGSLSVHIGGMPWPPASLGSHRSGLRQRWQAGWPPPGSVLPEAHGDQGSASTRSSGSGPDGQAGGRSQRVPGSWLGGRPVRRGLLQGLGPPAGRGWSGRLYSWWALLPQLPGLNLPLTGFSFLTCRWPNSTVLEHSSPWVMGTLLQNPS